MDKLDRCMASSHFNTRQLIISLVIVVLLLLDFDIVTCTDGDAAPYHIIQPPNNDYVQIASPDAAVVTLMCSLNVSIPAGMTITWLHNDTVVLTITTNGGTNTALLFRGGPTPSLAGHYQCAFNDDAGHILRRDITLLILYPPRIILPLADYHRVTFNESTSSVRLMCSLNITIPSSVTVTWTHNDNIVMSMHRNEVTQAGDTTTLHIMSPQPSDAGDYQCVFSGLDLQRTISLEFYGSSSSTTFMAATSVTVSTNMVTITSHSTTEYVDRSTSSTNNLINASTTTTTTTTIPTTPSVFTTDNLSIVIVTTSAAYINSTLVSSPMATFSTSQTNENTSVVVIAVIATLVVVILVTCTATVAIVGAVIYHKRKKTKQCINQSDIHSNATYGMMMQRSSSNAPEPVNGDPNEESNNECQCANNPAKEEDKTPHHIYSVPYGHIKLQPNPSYAHLSGTIRLSEKRDYYNNT